MHTIGSLIRQGRESLIGVSPTPDLDAAIILCEQLGIGRVKIISDSERAVSDQEAQAYFRKIERRQNYEPVAYITGKKEFYGLEIIVTPDVLIPRPETELIVELVLKKINGTEGQISLLDLGTGSGCLPVAIATEFKKQNRKYIIDAVDISVHSLKIAQENIEKHSLSNINLIQGSWFENLSPENKYNFIVSNPPYIAEGDKNVSPETAFEPGRALYSGQKGLADIEKIIERAAEFLKNQGTLLIEIGSSQAGAVKKIFSEKMPAGTFVIHKDLAGNDRTVEICNC